MRPEQPADPPLRAVATARGPLAASDAGEGPPLVMVPGYPGSARDFRWLEPAVAGAFRVLRPTLPGFGGQPRRGAGTVPEMAEEVLALLDALDIGEATLLGHSAGGLIVAEAARLDPDRVRALAFLAGPGFRPHRTWRRSRPPVLSRLLRTPLLGGATRRALPRAFAALGFPPTIPLPDLAWSVHCAGAIDWARHAANLRAIRVPCLVAWAEDDPIVEAAIAEELAAALPEGPRLRFPDGGHALQKHHAVEIGEALRRWKAASRER